MHTKLFGLRAEKGRQSTRKNVNSERIKQVGLRHNPVPKKYLQRMIMMLQCRSLFCLSCQFLERKEGNKLNVSVSVATHFGIDANLEMIGVGTGVISLRTLFSFSCFFSFPSRPLLSWHRMTVLTILLGKKARRMYEIGL